jgi:hypothetical protein
MSSRFTEAQRRPSVLLSAIVRIQIVWRGRLALIRARDARERELAELMQKEHRIFASLAPVRNITRTAKDLEDHRLRVARSKRSGATASVDGTTAVPQYRYLRRDSSSPSSVGVTPTLESSPVGLEGNPEVQVPRLDDNSVTKPPLKFDVHSAANVIKYFVRARLLVWRLREQRRQWERAFILREAELYKTYHAEKPKRRYPARHPPPAAMSAAPPPAKDAEAPPYLESQDPTKLMEQRPPGTLLSYKQQYFHPLEALVEKLVELKEATTSSHYATEQLEVHKASFRDLQASVRHILEEAHQHEETFKDNSGDNGNDDDSTFDLLADTATDLCIDIQDSLDASSSRVHVASSPPTTNKEMTIHDLLQSIRSSEERSEADNAVTSIVVSRKETSVDVAVARVEVSVAVEEAQVEVAAADAAVSLARGSDDIMKAEFALANTEVSSAVAEAEIEDAAYAALEVPQLLDKAKATNDPRQVEADASDANAERTAVSVKTEVDEAMAEAESEAAAEHHEQAEHKRNMQRDLRETEMFRRMELEAQEAARCSILVESFYDGATSWLQSLEFGIRTSISRTETAARKTMLDVLEMAEAFLRRRHCAIVTLQCWVRCVLAKRIFRIKAHRCEFVLLKRTALEEACELETQRAEQSQGQEEKVASQRDDAGVPNENENTRDGNGGAFEESNEDDRLEEGDMQASPTLESPEECLPAQVEEEVKKKSSRRSKVSKKNSKVPQQQQQDGGDDHQEELILNASISNHLNVVQQSIAATSIQRVFRGHLARCQWLTSLMRLYTFLEEREKQASRQDRAAVTIGASLRSFAARRQRQRKQAAVSLLLEFVEAADGVLQEQVAVLEASGPKKVSLHVAQAAAVVADDSITRVKDQQVTPVSLSPSPRADEIVHTKGDNNSAKTQVAQPRHAGAEIRMHYVAQAAEVHNASQQEPMSVETEVQEQVDNAGSKHHTPPHTINVPTPPEEEPEAHRPRPPRLQAIGSEKDVTKPKVADGDRSHVSVGGAKMRPLSARAPSTTKQHTAPRRPTTASMRKTPAADGEAPYVDGSHDSRSALRTLSSTPLFTLPAVTRPQPLKGRLVTGELAVSPTSVVDDDDDDSSEESPAIWKGGDSELQLQDTPEAEISKPPPLPHTVAGSGQKAPRPDYVNYVGMLEVLKTCIRNGLAPSSASPTHDDSRRVFPTDLTANPAMLHCDLVDVILARRGTSKQPLARQASNENAAATKRQSLTVLELDAPLVRSPIAGGENPLELRHTRELSDLWASDLFMDRVVQRLALLTPPTGRIEQYSFGLDEIAIAILSSIDTIADMTGSSKSECGGNSTTQSFAAKTQLCNGIPGMVLYEGQPVADKDEFEMFCEVFTSTCKLLAEERRTVDSATIASCFTILDVHHRRIIPRELFDSVFMLRVPLGESHRGGVPFLAFASCLRRNMIHTPMTCQKLMGTFFEKRLLKGNTAALEGRLRAVCSSEEQLRTLAVELLEAIGSVGEQSGASLADALVLYTALVQPSAGMRIRWFALSFMVTLYNHLNVQAMKCFAPLPQFIATLLVHHRAPASMPATTSTAAASPAGVEEVEEVWEGVLRAFADLVTSTAFLDMLRPQRLCDGASARKNTYRVTASHTEELDRCVPWSTLSLPCVDSLNYFAAQRVSFEDALISSVSLDDEGHIHRCTNPSKRGEAAAGGGNHEWLQRRGDGVAVHFFCSSASAHKDGFELRRRQWNTLLYSLRHYAICLSDVFALQYMSRSVAYLPPPMRRAVSQRDAEIQLLSAMVLHPDVSKSYPLRTEDDVDSEAHVSHRGCVKLFTNRFARMLFTLSVQEKRDGSTGGPRSWASLPLALRTVESMRNPDEFEEGTAPIPILSQSDANEIPLEDPVRASSRALHQYAVSLGSPLSSRPGSASSMQSNGTNNRARPLASDICSPPSRSSLRQPAPLTSPVPPPSGGVPPASIHHEANSKSSAGPPTGGSAGGCGTPKRTVVMAQIMSAFRGIPNVPQQQPPPQHSPHRPMIMTTPNRNAPGVSIGGGLGSFHVSFTPQAAVASATPPSGRAPVLLTQRAAKLLEQADENGLRGPSPPSSGLRQGVYPVFRNLRGATPPTMSS